MNQRGLPLGANFLGGKTLNNRPHKAVNDTECLEWQRDHGSRDPEMTKEFDSCTPRLGVESDPSLSMRRWKPQKDTSWGGTRTDSHVPTLVSLVDKV